MLGIRAISALILLVLLNPLAESIFAPLKKSRYYEKRDWLTNSKRVGDVCAVRLEEASFAFRAMSNEALELVKMMQEGKQSDAKARFNQIYRPEGSSYIRKIMEANMCCSEGYECGLYNEEKEEFYRKFDKIDAEMEKMTGTRFNAFFENA